MSRTSLPNDVARCTGVKHDGFWREGCEDCLRRTSPRGEYAYMLVPPDVIAFECELRIEPRVKE